MKEKLNRVAVKLLLAKDPEKKQCNYTWLGKRVDGLASILTGILVFFSPKKCWPDPSFKYVLWGALNDSRIAKAKEQWQTTKSGTTT